jgi:hypothetical protein
MAVSASLTVAPAAPNHGDTVTATYAVQGNDPAPPTSATVSGDANVGGEDFEVSTTVSLPGTPALPETFAVPTCPGLTFSATGAPEVFTAVVP